MPDGAIFQMWHDRLWTHRDFTKSRLCVYAKLLGLLGEKETHFRLLYRRAVTLARVRADRVNIPAGDNHSSITVAASETLACPIAGNIHPLRPT